MGVEDMMFRLALLKGVDAARAKARQRSASFFERAIGRLAVGTTLLVCLMVGGALHGASVVEPLVVAGGML